MISRIFSISAIFLSVSFFSSDISFAEASRAVPDGFTATPGNQKIVLEWNVLPELTYYADCKKTEEKLKESLKSPRQGNSSNTITTPGNATISGLENDKPYFCAVSAINPQSQINSSQIVTVTPSLIAEKKCFNELLAKAIKDKKSKAFASSTGDQSKIGVDLLTTIINKKLNHLLLISINDDLKDLAKQDAALRDVFNTATQELLANNPSATANEKILKAFGRLAITQAAIKLLNYKDTKAPNDSKDKLDLVQDLVNNYFMAKLDNSKKQNNQKTNCKDVPDVCYRNSVYSALIEIAKDDQFQVTLPDGTKVKPFSFFGFPGTLNEEFPVMDAKTIENLKDKLKGIFSPKYDSALFLYLDHNNGLSITTQAELFISRDFVRTNPEYKISANSNIFSLLFKLYDANKKADKELMLSSLKEMIYDVADTYLSEQEQSDTRILNANEVIIVRAIIHDTLDNVTYSKADDRYLFAQQTAVLQFAETLDKIPLMGQYFFLHFVIGTGYTYDDKSKLVPLVNEQLGLGLRLGCDRTGKVIPKIGLFASGLLYHAVYNKQETEGVMGGAFLAFDLYDTIQLNFSYYNKSLFAGPGGVAASSTPAWSVGIYIPLGEYLAELGKPK